MRLTARNFYRNGRRKDGTWRYRPLCKSCWNEAKKPSTPAQVEERRRYFREKRREYRQDAVRLERMRELDREYKQRAAEADREKWNAQARERYWLRRQAERAALEQEFRLAAPITRGKGDPTRVDSESFPALPAAPLLAAIDEIIRRERVFMNAFAFGSSANDGVQGAVCDRVGVIERRLNEWRRGLEDSVIWRDVASREHPIGPRLESGSFMDSKDPYPFVSFDLADRFLSRAGLLWWDVWSAEDVARNGRLVCDVFESTEISHAC